MVGALVSSIALLLLGAHALRYGDPGLTCFYAVLAGLAFSRQAWVRWAVVGVLAYGMTTWLSTALNLMDLRLMAGQPWLRLVLIMGGVMMFSALATTLLATSGQRYDRGQEHGPALGLLFLMTTGLLFLTRAKVPFPVVLADRYLPGWGGLEVLLLGLYSVWIGMKMLPRKGARLVRPRIWIGFSLIFFLQLGLGLLGLDQMLMTGQLHLPVPALIVGGPLFRGGGLFMLILLCATIVLVGPAWCSHLCYIGAWDDMASRMRGKRPRPGFPGRLSWGRGMTLALTVLLALGLRYAGVPGLTAVWLAAGFGLGGVGVMLMLSSRKGIMVHCTSYCPIGLLSNVLGKINPWRVRLNDQCTDCMTCSKFCRYGALDQATIARRAPGITCTLCGDCVSICPHGAAEYRFPGLTPQHARVAFLVFVISLHTLFLGVARI